MAHKRKKEFERIEFYYVEIENRTRKYGVGVNRHPWEFNPDRFYEWNTIVVTGKIRHIHSDIRSRRKFERMRMHLLPSRQIIIS